MLGRGRQLFPMITALAAQWVIADATEHISALRHGNVSWYEASAAIPWQGTARSFMTSFRHILCKALHLMQAAPQQRASIQFYRAPSQVLQQRCCVVVAVVPQQLQLAGPCCIEVPGCFACLRAWVACSLKF